MTGDDPQEEAAEEARRQRAAEAARLVALCDLRSLPVPSANLLTESPRDEDHYADLAERVVVVHWNSAVSVLDGGAGHADLLKLRDRLALHLREIEDQIDRWSSRDLVVSYVESVVAHEADRYGEDAVVEEAVSGDGAERPSGEEWWWEFERPEWQSPVGPPEFVRLRSPALDRLIPVSDLPWPSPKDWPASYYVTFGRGSTWRDCANRFKGWSRPRRRDQDDADRDILKAELVEFRLRVVERVLWEHEVLGHVGPLKRNDPTRNRALPTKTRFSLEQLLFIVLAHEAIESDPTGSIPRSVLLAGKKGEVGGVDARAIEAIGQYPSVFSDVQWSGDRDGQRGKARRLAGQPETWAYWSNSDDAIEDKDPNWTGPRDKRPYFDHVISWLYGEISALGFRTVEDIARRSWWR